MYGPNLQYSSIGSDNGLAPVRQQAIIWTNDGLVYRCIYASLSRNELTHRGWNKMATSWQMTIFDCIFVRKNILI